MPDEDSGTHPWKPTDQNAPGSAEFDATHDTQFYAAYAKTETNRRPDGFDSAEVAAFLTGADERALAPSKVDDPAEIRARLDALGCTDAVADAHAAVGRAEGTELAAETAEWTEREAMKTEEWLAEQRSECDEDVPW